MLSIGIVASSVAGGIDPYALFAANVSRFAVDSENNYLFTTDDGSSSTVFKYSAAGILLWSKNVDIELRRAYVDSSDNVVMLSRTGSKVVKLDSTGALQFDLDYGITSLQDVTEDSSGAYILVGYDSLNGIVIKTDSSGAITWQTAFDSGSSSPEDGYAYGVITDGSNNVFVLGYILEGSAENDRAIVVKFNSSGTYQTHNSWEQPNEFLQQGTKSMFFDGALFVYGDGRSYKLDTSTLAVSTAVTALGLLTNDGTYGYGYDFGSDQIVRFDSSFTPDLGQDVAGLNSAEANAGNSSLELVDNNIVVSRGSGIAFVPKTLDSVGTATDGITTISLATAAPSLTPFTVTENATTLDISTPSIGTADAGVTVSAGTVTIVKDVFE